jgi:excisionase family DNA binding protein
MTKRYLSIKEVSEYTSIPVKTLYEWASQGRIPSIKMGSRVLFDLANIDKVMARNKRQYIEQDSIV